MAVKTSDDTTTPQKRTAGYEPLIFGDLNCIRDKRLDAKNGREIFPGQSNWFTAMETNADLHDVQRLIHPNENLESWSHGRKNTLKRFRRLDYIIASRSTLSKVTDIMVTPTLSDHRMLTLHLSKKQEKIGRTRLLAAP
jgi:exonuclease III